MAKQWKAVLAAIIGIASVVTVYLLTGIFFETNDDRIISEILSGSFTGQAESRVVYVNFLLSVVLKGLYQVSVEVPWYGLYLVLQHILCLTMVLYSVYELCDSKKKLLVGSVLTLSVFLSHIYLVGQIQYTSTAALLAMTGYVCLMFTRDHKKSLVRFAVFEILAILLRQDAMLMIQPLGLSVYLGMIVIASLPLKDKVRKAAVIVGMLGGIWLIFFAGNWIGYYEKGWHEYDKFNDAGVMMYDYHGFAEYAEVQDILKQYRVSENEYEAYAKYAVLEGNLTAECAEELADYVAFKQDVNRPDLKAVVMQLIHTALFQYTWGMNVVTLYAWCVAVFVVILYKNIRLLVPILGLGCSHIVIWGYLLYRGRTPLRITLPLFLCETMLLFSIVVLQCNGKQRNRMKAWLLAGVCGIFCLLGMKAFSVQVDFLKESNSNQAYYIEGMETLHRYCDERPSNKYLLEANTMNYYRGSALETEIYGPHNNVITGGWYSYSPPMRERIHCYLEGYRNGVHLIIQDDGRLKEHPTVRYLSEVTGSEPVKKDSIALQHGGNCVVYYFAAPEEKK